MVSTRRYDVDESAESAESAGQSPRASVFALRAGNGTGYLTNEIGEGLFGSHADTQDSLASRLKRSLKLKPGNSDAVATPKKIAVDESIVEENTYFRFGDLVAELRNRVYYFYGKDRGNIPSSAITLGHSINGVYQRAKRPFPINLNITLVSRLIRNESLAIIGAELATRGFHLTHHDETMLQSPVEKAMLPAFGPYIQYVHLSRGGVLRCLQALLPHASKLKTIDVQLATHPRYRRTAVNHDFPSDVMASDVADQLSFDDKFLMQKLLDDDDEGVKKIRKHYKKAKKNHPELFVQGREWKVRFVIRVYLSVGMEDDANDDEYKRWRFKVTFEADTGRVVEVFRLPTDAIEAMIKENEGLRVVHGPDAF